MHHTHLRSLIQYDILLNRSYDLLLQEAKLEGLEFSGETFFTTIICGANGAFVLLEDDVPVVCHELRQGFDLPTQLIVFDSKGQRLSMTVQAPEASDVRDDMRRRAN